MCGWCSEQAAGAVKRHESGRVRSEVPSIPSEELSMRLLSRMSVPVALLAVAMAAPAVASAHSGHRPFRAPETRLSRRQHRRGQRDRRFHPQRGRLADHPAPLSVPDRRRRPGRRQLTGRGQVRRPRPLSARRRRGQQSDLGAERRIDGSLTPVPGSPFASGGVEPNSIAVHGNLVYVSNFGSPNYTGFCLDS